MNSLEGRLLVASPDLVDPNFRRTVVLMVQHNEDGAMGVVLNRPGNPHLLQLLQSIDTSDDLAFLQRPEGQTFVGGPVQPQMVTLLHSYETLFDARSSGIIPGVRVSHDLAVLERVLHLAAETMDGESGQEPAKEEAAAEEEGSDHAPRAQPADQPLGREGNIDEIFRLYCGYAGWGAGQVEDEVQSGSWLVVDARREHVFSTPTGFLWGRAIGELGEPYRRFSLMPFDPEAN